MAELPRLGRTSRTTLVTISSLRGVNQLLACQLLLQVATLTALLLLL